MFETKTLSSTVPSLHPEEDRLSKSGYLVLGIIIGGIIALVSGSILSWILASTPAEKAPWYIIRAAGILSYGLLWLSTVWGLLLSTRWFRAWGALMMAFHEFLSLLSLVFALLHAVTLHFDTYLTFTWAQILIPFLATPYRPFALGLGQVSFYLLLAIAISFYVRKRIGNKTWRMLHYTTLLVYGLVLIHAIVAGTDSWWTPLRLFYMFSGMIVLFLTYVRLLARPTG